VIIVPDQNIAFFFFFKKKNASQKEKQLKPFFLKKGLRIPKRILAPREKS